MGTESEDHYFEPLPHPHGTERVREEMYKRILTNEVKIEGKSAMKKSCLKYMAVIIAACMMVLSACSKGGVMQPGSDGLGTPPMMYWTK